MVAIAGDYLWSSYHTNALGRHEARNQPHASFQKLGADDHARREAYRQLIDAGLSPPRERRWANTPASRNRGEAIASGVRSKR